MDELQRLLSDLGEKGRAMVVAHGCKQGSTTPMHEFQHEQGGLDTTKATGLPLHTELSHSGPIGAIKNLTAAVKEVFLHPTSDGQTFRIGVGLTVPPDLCCCSGDVTDCLGDTIQPHT